MIHAIGDSHTLVFSGNEVNNNVYPNMLSQYLDWARAYRLGPVTAYNSHKAIEPIKEIKEKYVAPTDLILLSFGEIDCRVHLPHRLNIEECCSRYMETIKKVRDIHTNIGIWGPIASWPPEVKYTSLSNGDVYLRNKITIVFSGLISWSCDQLNIPFFSIFPNMQKEDGGTNPELLGAGGGIHLTQKALPLVKEKLKDYI